MNNMISGHVRKIMLLSQNVVREAINTYRLDNYDFQIRLNTIVAHPINSLSSQNGIT